MAITGLDENSFKDTLRKVLHVSEPIRSFQHLYGREKQLETIKRALNFPGRHIFIYGDRGVGKTSLAQTAAYQNHPINHEPIVLGCQPSSTFIEIMNDIATSIRSKNKTTTERSHKFQIGGSLLGGVVGNGNASYETAIRQSTTESEKNSPTDLNSAISLLKNLAAEAGGKLLIVIDEFDRIENEQQRKLFADFVKQVSDQEAPIQFIFCGVGRSLDELLVAHESSFRYFEGIPLERLIYQGRIDIIDQSASALGISVNDRHRFRIAAISDGFPHYIHLICTHLFWEMFNSEETLAESTQETYDLAIRQTVVGIETTLKRSYEKAALRDDDEYELALWAAADHGDLQRSSKSIYESYNRLAGSLGRDSLTPAEFSRRLQKLKTGAHGRILKTFRHGWYEFSENIVRGYVRLRAEDSGCALALEYDSKPSPRVFTAGISKASQRPLPFTRSSFGRPPGR